MNVYKLDVSPKRKSNFFDHHYYGPLIDAYTKSILKSGLLLDEDLEILLSISKFGDFPQRCGYRPSLNLLASTISLVGSAFLAKKIRMPLIIVPPVIASVYFVILEFKRERKKKQNDKLIDTLLEVVNKTQKLTKNVVKYMKTRCDLGKTKEENCLLLYGKNVEEFTNVFLEHNSNLCDLLIRNLQIFAVHSAELEDDFRIIEYLNSSDILKCDNLNGIETCLEFTQKVYDVNVLLFSKLLSYVGVLFYSETLLESDLKKLIDDTLPSIVKTLQYHHDTMKNFFVSLRHSTHKKAEIKQQQNVDTRKNISTKLEATLVSSVNNLSVILEKSQHILDKLEESDDNTEEIGNAIVDLTNHTFATYESLDLLCRLYGIVSNCKINQSDDEKINKTSFKDASSSEALPVLNYDDDNEPVEEKYELYVGKEEGTEEHQVREYEDQSNAYLSLMLQELKQSLKQHERFIEAKNKRGDEDDEETQLERKRKSRKEKSPPKFDLRQLKDEPIKKEELGEHSVEEVVNLPKLPPPLPPPLPAFSLGELEPETGQVNARSMLENIKVLSNQRNVQEEVFGDTEESSDESE